MLIPSRVFLLAIIVFGQLAKLTAQENLVPNPSFEDTISCPYSAGDIDKSVGWIKCGSADYFHTCNTYDWGVPNNVFGYQQPIGGNAYSGFVTFSSNSPNTREFIACNFSSPLTVGQTYYISFKVVLSLNSFGSQTNCGSDKIGAMFTTYFYNCDTLLASPFITNNPPIYTNAIVSDSLNWTRITGSFVADSAYTYLILGNFFDDANTDTLKFFNDFSDNAYYFLDDVCVSIDSSFAYNYSFATAIPENDLQAQISIFPNPAMNFITINSELQTEFDIECYNSIGQLIYHIRNMGNNNFMLDISKYSNGLYYIKITSENNHIMYKLLKQ